MFVKALRNPNNKSPACVNKGFVPKLLSFIFLPSPRPVSPTIASWAGNEARPVSHYLLAIFDDNTLSASLRECCQNNGVLSPTGLAASCSEENDLKEDLLSVTEVTDTGLQGKISSKPGWLPEVGW